MPDIFFWKNSNDQKIATDIRRLEYIQRREIDKRSGRQEVPKNIGKKTNNNQYRQNSLYQARCKICRTEITAAGWRCIAS